MTCTSELLLAMRPENGLSAYAGLSDCSFAEADFDSVQAEAVADVARMPEAYSHGANRRHWEQRWGETLERFRAAPTDEAARSVLTPEYVDFHTPLRLNGRYVMPLRAGLEERWLAAYRARVFRWNLAECKAVYEFGCGSGHNLLALAEMFPEKRFVGLDWSPSALDLVAAMQERFEGHIDARSFNFFAPDFSMDLPPGTGVLTLGAMEQTGRGWPTFVRWLMEKKPLVCVHLEPVLEWYTDSPFDRVAAMHHRKRRYWTSFPVWLAEMAVEGKVQVIEMQRVPFGSRLIEGYSRIVWRPI